MSDGVYQAQTNEFAKMNDDSTLIDRELSPASRRKSSKKLEPPYESIVVEDRLKAQGLFKKNVTAYTEQVDKTGDFDKDKAEYLDGNMKHATFANARVGQTH